MLCKGSSCSLFQPLLTCCDTAGQALDAQQMHCSYPLQPCMHRPPVRKALLQVVKTSLYVLVRG